MIDFEGMKKYLDFITSGICNKKFISRNELITCNDISQLRNLAKQYGITNIKKLFVTTDDTNYCKKYEVEIECEKCGCIFHRELSKENFVNYINEKYGKINIKNLKLCQECEKYKNIKDNEMFIENMEKIKKEQENGALYFINNLLDPSSVWKKECSYRDRINECMIYSKMAINIYGQKKLSDFILNNLGYYDYLKTPYWKALSLYIKYKNNYKCSLCGSNENLVAHHNTYEHIGNELYHITDLVCICQECHEKYHFE